MTISGFLTAKHAKKLCHKLGAEAFPAIIVLNHVSTEVYKKLLNMGYKGEYVCVNHAQMRIVGQYVSTRTNYGNGDIDAGDDEELFLELAKVNFNNRLCVLIEY